jgi:hypothetical protein
VVLKQEDGHWHNFVLDKRVQSYGESAFEIRQSETKEKNILIGVATDAILGQTDAYKNDEAMVYITGDGFVCEGGRDREAGRVVRDGETITVKVDRVKGKISWYVRNELLATANLLENMR